MLLISHLIPVDTDISYLTSIEADHAKMCSAVDI